MNRDLTHLGTEHKAFDTDKVAYIQQFLEYHVVHLLFYRSSFFALRYGCLDVIAADIDLDTAFGVLELDKRGLTHDTFGHQTTGYTHLVARMPGSAWLFASVADRAFINESGFDVRRKTCNFILRRRVGIYAQIAHSLQTLTAH